MDFGFTEDQLALRAAVRDVSREHADLASLAGREGKAATAGAWSALADLEKGRSLSVPSLRYKVLSLLARYAPVSVVAKSAKRGR